MELREVVDKYGAHMGLQFRDTDEGPWYNVPKVVMTDDERDKMAGLNKPCPTDLERGRE